MDVLPAGLQRRLSPNWAYAVRLVLLIVLVSAIGIGLGVGITNAVESPRWLSADRSFAEDLHGRTCDTWLWPTVLGLSVLGWPVVFYVTIGGLIVLLLVRRQYALVAFFVITGLSGGIVDTAVKETIDRARPMLGGCNVGLSGKSFPSGHLMVATICYGMLLVALLPLARSTWRRRALIGFVVFALCASAFARSAVGAHYASDIVGGLLLGLLWLAVATWAYVRWRSDSGRVPSSVRSGVAPEALDRLRRRPARG
ncbi:MAG: phosphatase PAP2 family protein [Mycobacteriales bacterium]